MSQFLGRFHPLIVHLPIGFLLLGVLFDLLGRTTKFSFLRTATPLTYLLGGITGLMACMSGYLLSVGESYNPSVLDPHFWSGVSITLFAFIVFALYQFQVNVIRLSYVRLAIPFVFLIGLTLVGHMGGSLTHGEDYLTKYAPPAIKSMLGQEATEEVLIHNVQEADVYTQLIDPILEEKCYECHNQSKQNGKLRLDSPDMIQKGGRSGKELIIAGDAGASEIFRRMILPMRDKKHMPPSGKSQLSGSEIELVRWWIDQGGKYEGKVEELAPSATVSAIFASMEGEAEKDATKLSMRQFAYAGDVDLPSEGDVAAIKATGAVVLPLWEGAPFLQINYINARDVSPEDLTLLKKVGQQLIWLKLSNKKVGDEALKVIGELPHIQKLHLNGTEITDEGLAYLSSLEHLSYLNIVSTDISGEGLANIVSIPALRELYVFNTKVKEEDVEKFTSQYPDLVIEKGGYQLPILEGDTSLLTLNNE